MRRFKGPSDPSDPSIPSSRPEITSVTTVRKKLPARLVESISTISVSAAVTSSVKVSMSHGQLVDSETVVPIDNMGATFSGTVSTGASTSWYGPRYIDDDCRPRPDSTRREYDPAANKGKLWSGTGYGVGGNSRFTGVVGVSSR